MITIKREMAEIGFELRKALMIPNQQTKARQIQIIKTQKSKKVDELVKAISHLYMKGRWVYSQMRFLQASNVS